MTHCVRDLSTEQKLVVESLLGRPVSDEESVSIRAFAPGPNEEERKAALEGLKQHFARIDAKRRPASDEEADAIINEALRSVRPNYRSV
jgi:hypothetical protein